MLNITDLPLDSYTSDDADNTTLLNGVQDPTPDELKWLEQFEHTYHVNAMLKGGAQLDQVSAPTLYVPLKRNIRLGSRGNDCFAVKRALSRAGFGAWGFWGRYQRSFGLPASKHLKAFQAKLGITQEKGVYGPVSHAKLTPYFDAYGAYLMGAKANPVRPKTKRDVIVSTAMFGYNNRSAIHYTESSWRMYGVRNHLKPPAVPRYEDCSSFATWCYYVAGAKDPNGLSYNGQGYTGTLIQYGKKVSIGTAQPGDLIFYGKNAVPSHVAIYVGNNRVISNGSEVGPLLLNWNYRSDVHSIRSYL